MALYLWQRVTRPLLLKVIIAFPAKDHLQRFLLRVTVYQFCCTTKIVVPYQCDQIGRFLKGLGLQIFFKKLPNFVIYFWAKVKNIILYIETSTFWATFGKTWATFSFKFWAHCCSRERER